ncbi:hypothetical protein ES708_17855 [subsurface metagenome]
MSFFSRKQKISLEDYCRDFYDNQILNPIIKGVNFGTKERGVRSCNITK